MKQEYIDFYVRVATVHRELTALIVDMESATRANIDLQDLADLGLALREAQMLTNNLNRQVVDFESLVARMFTAIWGLDPDSPAEVETEWCACSPNPKVKAKLPGKDDPEGYLALMDEVGLPRDMAETGLFRLSFDAASELATKLTREGKPLPKGLGKTWTEHSLKIKSRRKLAKEIPGARLDGACEEENENDRDGESPF